MTILKNVQTFPKNLPPSQHKQKNIFTISLPLLAEAFPVNVNNQRHTQTTVNISAIMSSNNKRLRGEDAEQMEVGNEIGEDSAEVTSPQGLPLSVVQVPDPPRPYKVLPEAEHPDWIYSMRRSMQEIIPGLFLGPYAVATKTCLELLQNTGITHILCVRHIREKSVIRLNHPDHFQYAALDIADDAETLLIPYLRQAHVFIDKALNSGGKVLVHGNAGISRSAAIVIAYIMAVYGVSYYRAFRYVQSKRLTACPSEWFTVQLKEYEVLYQAIHDVPHPLPQPGQPSVRPPLKRIYTSDEDDDEDEIN